MFTLKDNDITYDVIEQKGILGTSKNGWTKQYNLISWNKRPAVHDIRSWSPESKMSKGITLTDNEIKMLKGILDKDLETKIIERYNKNHFELKKIVSEINVNGATEFGLSDPDKSYEQGINDALEFVLREFGIEF